VQVRTGDSNELAIDVGRYLTWGLPPAKILPRMLQMPSITGPLERRDSGSPEDHYVQANLGHALRIWWAFYWPTTLISFVLEIAFSYMLRLSYENLWLSAAIVRAANQASGFLITYVIAIFVWRYILKKGFRHFRIALQPSVIVPDTPTVEVTYRRTLRVWWIYVWRTFAYYLLAWAFVIYPAGMFAGLFRPSPAFGYAFGVLLGFVVSGALALFVIYSNILEEDIGDFRVNLVPRQAAVESGQASATDMAIG
jgi:hypothetical protein